MTRFARAKGSKASNERIPEEATSWSEMKQQLLEKNKEAKENKNRQDALEKRNANYKAFLDEKEESLMKNTSWADFPEADNSSTPEKKKKNKVKLLNKTKDFNRNEEICAPNKNNISEPDTTCIINTNSDSDEAPDEQSSKQDIAEPVLPKPKKIKSTKLLKITLDKQKQSENSNKDQTIKNKSPKKRKAAENVEGAQKKLKKIVNNKNVDTTEGKQINGKKVKKIVDNRNVDTTEGKQINGKKVKKVVKENLTEQDLKKIERKKQKRIRQLEKKKRVKAELKKQKEEQEHLKGNQVEENGNQTENQNNGEPIDKSAKNNYPKNTTNKPKQFTDKQRNKEKDGDEHKRRKPFQPHKMFINGKELEIEYVDGFPVKKEDSIRLKKLRREMISKGLPRSEINIALKLERRKAEKAFAKEKKKVCFYCRKSGHNLSECPDVNKSELAQTNASGICFKCGSTEHTHFECKVVRGQEFKYATCFICKEEGHIARQCPDNAKGLYPKGGACNECGDVTHFKKDCPKYQAQQQKLEQNIRLETIGHSNPDTLEENDYGSGRIFDNKKSNKIIKF